METITESSIFSLYCWDHFNFFYHNTVEGVLVRVLGVIQIQDKDPILKEVEAIE